MHERRSIGRVSAIVAELAVVVASPGVGVSVAAHGQRMIESGAHLQGLQPFARVGGAVRVVYLNRES